MDLYLTGSIIKKMREKKNYTQLELAKNLNVSEKTISKWETKRGFPDVSLLEDIAKALDVSLIELFNGEEIINDNKHANVLKTVFYVCPICKNIVTSLGKGAFSCCGNTLIPQEAEEDNDINIEYIEDDIFVTIDSRMLKNDYIAFIAYVTSEKMELVKLYPEQMCEVRFKRKGHGLVYYYDIRNGLFRKKI